MGAEQVLTNRVSAVIAPWAGDVDFVHIGLADSPQVCGELLEVIRAVLDKKSV
jgi:hypothetical protein